MTLFEIDSVSITQLPKEASLSVGIECKQFKDQIKYGRIDALDRILNKETIAFLKDKIGTNVTLVPLPKSAPLMPNSVWPSSLICEKLMSIGIGHGVFPILERLTAVKPGHLTGKAEDRVTVQGHFDSIGVKKQGYICQEKIVMVDDVVTQGRFAAACYRKLREVCPDSVICLFTPIASITFEPVTELKKHRERKVKYYNSGRTFVE